MVMVVLVVTSFERLYHFIASAQLVLWRALPVSCAETWLTARRFHFLPGLPRNVNAKLDRGAMLSMLGDDL